MIAASTRCAPCWGDIPALNKMVEKYAGKLEFVMFFWDDLKGIQRMQKKLDPRIKLIPPTKKFDNKAYTESFGFCINPFQKAVIIVALCCLTACAASSNEQLLTEAVMTSEIAVCLWLSDVLQVHRLPS